MTLKLEYLHDTLIANPEGRIDTNNYAQFEEQIIEALSKEPSRIILNLADLFYMSSSGLRVFVMLQKKMTASGKKLILCNLQEGIQDIFDISGLSSVFTITTGLQEALNI